MVISLLIWTLFGILIAYLSVMGIITIGWIRIPASTSEKASRNIKVSLVIAIRNESPNLPQLITCLKDQSYEKEFLEVIFVDDNSDDNPAEIIETETIKGDLRINLIFSGQRGKKNALKKGVEFSSGELIITTDGDCTMGPLWVSSIVSYYLKENKKVITGPVIYSKENSRINSFFNADFASLVASGAGSIGASLPLMGNGANLAFNRDVYNGFENLNSVSASGDDVFLIHHASKKYGYGSIGFIKNEDAIVTTLPPLNCKEFFSQRIRWASKAGSYTMPWAIIVSLVVFLFNLELVLLFLGSLYYTWLFPVFILLIITKYFIDFPLIYRYMNFAGLSKLKPLFMLMELFYPFYTTYISFLSFFRKFTWKDRQYR